MNLTLDDFRYIHEPLKKAAQKQWEEYQKAYAAGEIEQMKVARALFEDAFDKLLSVEDLIKDKIRMEASR